MKTNTFIQIVSELSIHIKLSTDCYIVRRTICVFIHNMRTAYSFRDIIDYTLKVKL